MQLQSLIEPIVDLASAGRQRDPQSVRNRLRCTSERGQLAANSSRHGVTSVHPVGLAKPTDPVPDYFGGRGLAGVLSPVSVGHLLVNRFRWTEPRSS